MEGGLRSVVLRPFKQRDDEFIMQWLAGVVVCIRLANAVAPPDVLNFARTRFRTIMGANNYLYPF